MPGPRIPSAKNAGCPNPGTETLARAKYEDCKAAADRSDRVALIEIERAGDALDLSVVEEFCPAWDQESMMPLPGPRPLIEVLAPSTPLTDLPAEGVFLATWSGGYEDPQIEAFVNEQAAKARFEEWMADARENEDRVSLLHITAAPGTDGLMIVTVQDYCPAWEEDDNA